MKYLSFIVDKNPRYYYQAQLLLHSITSNTHFQRKNIVVQCVEGVDKIFLDYLKNEGFTYTIVQPYLDHAYCNKLTQLAYFRDKEVQSVILLDTDTYLVDNGLFLLEERRIMGKMVDAPNPPLPIIESIFSEAAIALPPVIETDWIMSEGVSVEGNFNGGLYYIPGSCIAELDRSWRKWAEWLYARKYLFQNEAYAIHVDQLSFAMALKESNLPYGLLPTNYNFPTHLKNIPRYFDGGTPVHMLHYHRQMNDFGMMDTSQIAEPKVLEAAQHVNAQIAEITYIDFYRAYKKASVPSVSQTLSEDFKAKVRQLLLPYSHMQCYLHVGTPKTATTSFQYICADNEAYLISQGVFYADNYTPNGVPKHQWLVSVLLSGDVEPLLETIRQQLEKAQSFNVHSVLFTTEGIFNHWWDFPAKSKEMLHLLSQVLNMKPLLVLREPSSFLYSYYQQNLKNPRMEMVTCYGQSWSFERMIQDQWFIKHIDYLAFIDEMEMLFGKGTLTILTYSRHIVEDLFTLLGIEMKSLKIQESQNISLSPIAIELLQTLNSFAFPYDDKQVIIEKLIDCDQILSKYKYVQNTDTKKDIKQLFSLQSRILNKCYGIEWKE